jgi:hypothetical protein
MKEVQRYYKQELGVTFTLNDPVVEVVKGERVRSDYENTPQWGEKYWYSVANMQIELRNADVSISEPPTIAGLT